MLFMRSTNDSRSGFPSDRFGVGQQVPLRLTVPQAVVRLAQLVQPGKQRIGPALLLKRVDGRQVQVNMVVDQLFPAGNPGPTVFSPPIWVTMAAGLSFPAFIISMASRISLVLPPEVPTR